VLQRGVEQLAMNKVFREARRMGCVRVVARYIATAKNGMVKDFYDRFGFDRLAASDADGVTYCLDVEHYVPQDVYIREMDVVGGATE
jgi:predicted enzyme involved in methoxymalonyl-ACP biosynthesis